MDKKKAYLTSFEISKMKNFNNSKVNISTKLQFNDSNSIEYTSKQKLFNSTVGLHLNNSTNNLEVDKNDQRNGKNNINNDFEKDFNVLNNLQVKGKGIREILFKIRRNFK